MERKEGRMDGRTNEGKVEGGRNEGGKERRKRRKEGEKKEVTKPSTVSVNLQRITEFTLFFSSV